MKNALEDMWDFILDTLPIWILMGMLAVLLSGLCYIDGNAKANWIKQTKGVEMPWWEAMCFDIEINSTDAEVKLSQ